MYKPGLTSARQMSQCSLYYSASVDFWLSASALRLLRLSLRAARSSSVSSPFDRRDEDLALDPSRDRDLDRPRSSSPRLERRDRLDLSVLSGSVTVGGGIEEVSGADDAGAALVGVLVVTPGVDVSGRDVVSELDTGAALLGTTPLDTAVPVWGAQVVPVASACFFLNNSTFRCKSFQARSWKALTSRSAVLSCDVGTVTARGSVDPYCCATISLAWSICVAVIVASSVAETALGVFVVTALAVAGTPLVSTLLVAGGLIPVHANTLS